MTERGAKSECRSVTEAKRDLRSFLGEAVWVHQEGGFLHRIDRANNALIEQIKLDQSLTGGGVLVSSDSIWTAANEDDLLIRLSLSD